MNPIDIKQFILSFARLRNPEEAALNAGVSPVRARTEGAALLNDRKVKRLLRSMEKQMAQEEIEVRAGLERIAYGRINDAAALAFAEEATPEMIARADLFNVSEIKKVKGGGVELKFFDRQKALEKLQELDIRQKSDRKAKDLVKAIYGSSQGSVTGDIPQAEEDGYGYEQE